MQSSKTTEEKEKNKDQIYITFRLKEKSTKTRCTLDLNWKTNVEKEKHKEQMYIRFRLKDYCTKRKAQRPDLHYNKEYRIKNNHTLDNQQQSR